MIFIKKPFFTTNTFFLESKDIKCFFSFETE